MESPRQNLPRWALLWLHLFIHQDYREEIEGDLNEKYQMDYLKYGRIPAKKALLSACISLLKFNLFFNLNHFSIMTKRNWFILLLVSLIIIVGSISPFLPGPRNDITHGFSRFAQTIGFVGLVFVPFGLLWLIIEWRNKKDQKLNRWTNGYYPAWLTLTPVFVFIPMQIGRTIRNNGSLNNDLWPLAVIVVILGFIIMKIQKLKNKSSYKFNRTPVYLLLMPLVAMAATKLAVNNAAAYTREAVIEKSEPLITALENYKNTTGAYPEQLNELVGTYITEMPNYNAMGLRAYQYQKYHDKYQLSFEQRYHWFATEVVAYMKNGHEITKANYDNYPTKNPEWRYFMVD